MMNKVPDRLYIDENDRKLYDEVIEEIFRGKIGDEEKRWERKDQFLLAMAIGFKNEVRRPLKKKEGFIRKEYLKPEDKALINAIAIYDTGSIEVLLDKQKVFSIAEEYAHAGIRILHGEIKSGEPGSYLKKLEKDLFEKYKGLKNRL